MFARFFTSVGFLALMLTWGPVSAADPVSVIAIHNGQFEPKALEMPAGTKVKVVVRNMDSTPAEFESVDLSREVVVPAHGEVSLFVGPLEQGQYEFFNDFNREMKGSITVKGGR